MTAVDLRTVVEQAWGRGKRAGKATLYGSRWREDRHPSFAVYADGFKDFATGEHGDHLDFVRHEFGLDDRRAAAAWLAEHGYDVPADQRRQRTQIDDRTETDAPPAAAWQESARRVIEQAQQFLWSGQPDALKALAYLRGRGLTDDTIRAAMLGFNPRSVRVEMTPGELVSIPAGVTMPVIVEGVTWAVKVNTFGAAGLARAFGRQPDERIAKYIHVRGSKTGAPYLPSGVLPDDLPAIIVEGEYDALIAQQQLDGLAQVITVGSATNHLARRWRGLLGGRSVYIIPDNDDAGRGGAARLASQLPNARVVSLPTEVKDANEFHLTGGDLRGWFTGVMSPQPPAQRTDAKAERDALRAGWLPAVASWVAALNDLRGGGVNVSMVYVLALAGVKRGVIDAQNFTAGDLMRVSAAVGWQLDNDKIIRRGLALATEIGFLTDLTVNRSPSLIVNFVKNPGGRPEHVYALPSGDDMHMAILRASSAEIDELAYPTPDDDPDRAALAELTPLALEQAGVSADDAKAVATDFRRARSAVRTKRDGAAWYRTKEKRETLAASLRDTTPLALDPAIPVTNAKTFRIAVFRALASASDGEQVAQRELAKMAGVRSRTTLKKVMAAARVGVKEQSVDELTETRLIEPGEDARAAIRRQTAETGGAAFALRITPTEGEQRSFSVAVAPGKAADIAAEHLAAGRSVAVEYRRAYRLNVLPADSPAPVLPSGQPGRTRQIGDPVTSPARREQTEQAEQVEIGRYRPLWVAGQVAYLLTRLGWYQQLETPQISEWGELVKSVFRNPRTGDECSGTSRDLAELLRIFTGRDVPVISRDDDDLISFSTRILGATVEQVG